MKTNEEIVSQPFQWQIWQHRENGVRVRVLEIATFAEDDGRQPVVIFTKMKTIPKATYLGMSEFMKRYERA